jgi:nucleotide-binding universal stress UspA family protein
MLYKKILIAIDGSDAAQKAFEKALQVAKNNDAEIVLTHVIDVRTFASAGAYDRTLSERAEKYGKELLEEYVEKSKEAGITNVTTSLEYGSPKVKIAKDIADKFEADLIIAGATGMNAVERFLIGSVTESITRYAKCDVLIVR